MLIAIRQGANGSQPRKLPTFVLSSAPSHKSTSDLCHSDKPQSSGSLQRHASTATGTHALKNGTFQAPRHHDHSYYNRLMQRYHGQSEHTVPHSDVFKPRTLDRVSQKNSSLQGGVNNASGPEVSIFNSNRESVLADRKSISETPGARQV